MVEEAAAGAAWSQARWSRRRQQMRRGIDGEGICGVVEEAAAMSGEERP
jgi:hypothetical protein